MPMFRDFVPPKIRPWIYLLIAVTFQFSGGLYMGTVNQMAGETILMREDLMMCLYANLAGMAIWFPMLFRMKFRFTNRMLLLSAAAGVLLCNLTAPHITCLPLLWAVCFVEGICKIQGTFECMSTIQLWMTPERDFTVFFPFLHIVILGSMQLSDLASTWLMYYFHWSFMHYLVAGLMIIDLLVIFFCTTWARVAPKLPLLGIDWLGGIMWAALLLQVAFFFNYGQFYDWWNSPVMRRLAVSGVLTLLLCIGRMISLMISSISAAISVSLLGIFDPFANIPETAYAVFLGNNIMTIIAFDLLSYCIMLALIPVILSIYRNYKNKRQNLLIGRLIFLMLMQNWIILNCRLYKIKPFWIL